MRGRGWRRRRTPKLTLEEAERIRRQDAVGRLERDDPHIGRLVGEANRVVHRSLLWGAGEGDPRRHQIRGVLIVGGMFVIVSILGFLLPILLVAAP